MNIDWQSWEDLRFEGFSPTHLDRETGVFLSDDQAELQASKERYLTLYRVMEPRADRMEKACLQHIADPELRRVVLAARRKSNRLASRSFPSSEARTAERKRLEERFRKLLAGAPEVEARWNTRHDRLARSELWTLVQWEKLPVDNPPPWVDDVAAFRGESQRGWQAFLADQGRCQRTRFRPYPLF